MTTVSQFIRYAIVGLANAALDFSIVNLLSVAFGAYRGTPILFINSVSAAAVIAQSYFLNKHWTFRSAGPDRLALPKFVAVNLGAFVLNTGLVYGLTTFVPPPLGFTPLLWLNAVKVIAIAAVVIWNFSGFKFIVFRPPAQP